MPFNQEISESSKVANCERKLQRLVKQMLQGRLFEGTCEEKKYVDNLESYRDVIVISNEETDLIRALKAVKNCLQAFYDPDIWIGVTGPDVENAPAENCLWVELPEETFGRFWYKISRVVFKSNEISLRVKAIRPISANIVANTDSAVTSKDVSKSTSSVLFEAMVTILSFFGDFTIKFIRELSGLLKTASPILVACIELIGKLIGGHLMVSM